jgi:hypothetical protein
LSLILDIGQGAGLSGASGVRPFLPALLTGALARADAGLDFDGTDYAFLESAWFLGAVVLLAVAAATAGRSRSGPPITFTIGAIAVIIGALEFAGSLAGEDHASGPGLVAGAVCALLGYAAMTTFLGRARGRLAARRHGEATGYMTAFGDAAGVALAGLAVLAPPVAYVPLAFCVWILIERRRRAGQKYEGLRVLR